MFEKIKSLIRWKHAIELFRQYGRRVGVVFMKTLLKLFGHEAMPILGSKKFRSLAKIQSVHDLELTIVKLAGLLTIPSLQANTVRLETVAHLAVAHCRGGREPTSEDIGSWVNSNRASRTVIPLEDPAEETFVTNIGTPFGNFRLFEGNTNSNDYLVQTLLVTLGGGDAPNEWRRIVWPIMALLKVSECVAEQLQLERWTAERSIPGSRIEFAGVPMLEERCRAVTFSRKRLASAEISRDDLSKFVFREQDKETLLKERIGHTSLERRPLIEVGESVIVALPHCIGRAITRYVVDEIRKLGCVDKFLQSLTAVQGLQIEEECRRKFELRVDVQDRINQRAKSPLLRDWVLTHDLGKFLHIVFLQDSLNVFEEAGLRGVVEYQDDVVKTIYDRVKQVRAYCSSLREFDEGTTLVVVGGLGRGLRLVKDRPPEKWHSSVVGIAELLMIAQAPGRELTQFLKCIRSKKALEESGLKFVNTHGDFALYCSWKENDYLLVPRHRRVGPGTVGIVLPNFNLPVRRRIRRALDQHAIPTYAGAVIPVIRLHSDSYFPYLRESKIYGSLLHASKNIIAGAVETDQGVSWFSVDESTGAQVKSGFVYDFWYAFIDFFGKVVLEVERFSPNSSHSPLEIRLDLSRVKSITNFETKGREANFRIGVNIGSRIAKILFPPDFLKIFGQPENSGERLVLHNIARGLMHLHLGSHGSRNARLVDEIVCNVIGDERKRLIHAFRSDDPFEQFQQERPRDPTFVTPEDCAFLSMGLVDSIVADERRTIIEKTECNRILHGIVTKLFNQKLQQLKKLDRRSVISEMLKVHENIIRDRFHWSRTARSVEALHSEHEDVVAISREREGRRSTAGLAARAVVEMAVCHCPEKGGRPLGRWQLDELLALTTLLLEAAMDSDAIYSDLVSPRMQLHSNGEYSIDRSFHVKVAKPFLAALHRDQFGESVEAYGELYRDGRENLQVPVEEKYSPELRNAFEGEYGLSLTEALEGCDELVTAAIEEGMAVYETTLGNLRARLREKRGFSSEACDGFFRTFGLFHRERWADPPKGFARKDLYPWRFSRRLSLMARPLLIFGSEDSSTVVFGIATVRVALAHLAHMIEEGHLSQDFFETKRMRSFIGRTNNERGHEFAQSVSKQLRKMKWKTRLEVNMTELGAAKELGDIDVLAWDSTGKILIIECKRLQLARTIGEIADVCRRFRGEAKDELAKHVRRVDWIKGNYSGLKAIVGINPRVENIDDRLVTNIQVPMTFLKSLPVGPDKIGPLN